MGRCNVLLDWVGGPFAIITENMPRAVLGRGANNLSSQEAIDRPAKNEKPQNLEQCCERVNLAGEEARHFSHPRPRSDTLEPRAVMQRATRNTLYGAEK